jgi:drug/metabolite transporter (DMT)-like permease
MQVAAFRMSIAFLALIPLIIWNIKRLKIPNHKWKYIPLLALFGNIIPAILFSTAETKIDSGLAGIINATTPLFALSMGYLFFKVPLTQTKIIGVVVGFVGAVIVVLSKQINIIGINYYIFMPLVATLFYGINANIFKKNFQTENPVTIALLQFSFAAPFALAYLQYSGAFHTIIYEPAHAWMSIKYLLILGAFGTGYSLVFFNILIQRTSALFGTMTTYLIPLVSIAIGLIDNERIMPVHFFGLFIILTGVYIGSRSR